MRVTYYQDWQAFYKAAEQLLWQDERQWFLPLASALEGNPPPPLLLAVHRAGQPVLCGFGSPPHFLCLCGGEDGAALEALCRSLVCQGAEVPGVFAPAYLASAFALQYCALTGLTPVLEQEMNLLCCEAVAEGGSAPGALRPATEADLAFLPQWEAAFDRTQGDEPDTPAVYLGALKARIAQKRHFLWQDGGPVCQAILHHTTPNGAMLNHVYTPPRFQGRGYGRACVAALTARLLAGGARFCLLYVHTTNGAANHIYEKTGYSRLHTTREIRFEHSAGDGKDNTHVCRCCENKD